MTITIEELAESMGGLDKLSEAAEALKLTLKDSYDEADPELEKLKNYQPEEKSQPPKLKKQKKDAIEPQQEERKGQLAKANQAFAKTAIAKTTKQMAQVADLEMRAGATAYLSRKTQNLETLTATIEEYSDLTTNDMTALEAELDIEALLGEVADPLPSFA